MRFFNFLDFFFNIFDYFWIAVVFKWIFWVLLDFFLNIKKIFFLVRKGKYRTATPTAAPPPRSGYPPQLCNGLDWRALVESRPPNIGKQKE